MKLTKFAQSCMLIETKGKRILVDPGYFEYDAKLLESDWNNIDILLVTHWHGDHLHEEAVKQILKNEKTAFYTTKEVASHYPDLKPHIVKQGDTITKDPIEVQVVKAVHGFVPFLRGKYPHENVGYIIGDGDTKAYCTSDTIGFDNDYQADVVCLPVSGHGLVFGPFEAALFAKDCKAKLAIPVHNNNPKFPVDFTAVEAEFKKQEMPCKVLEIGESVEV